MTNIFEDRFDRMLGQTLHRHREPAPADFTERMMKAIERAEQQRILAGVVLQERLALAASAALGIAAIVAVVFFPSAVAGAFGSIGRGLVDQGGALAGRIPQALAAIGRQWQLYAVLGAAAAVAIYSLLDLLLGDRLRTA